VIWELLLEWMTHVGSGRWSAFRDAAAELSGTEDDDLQNLCRSLRITLSDLGHADFFVEGTSRWYVRRPALLGLLSRDGAVLSGGRTRRLVSSVTDAASEAGIPTTAVDLGGGVSQIQVPATPAKVADLARALGIEYVPAATNAISSRLTPVRRLMEQAPACAEPVNWAVRSWSFDSKEWVEGRLRKTAREYSSRHGVRRFMVEVGHGELREIEKREAIYAAALLRSWRILNYNAAERRLRAPLSAPLPDLHARAACLAGGSLPQVKDGFLVFGEVPPDAAFVLCVLLGQGHPLQGARL
jgi:hypothetical protein